MAKVRYCERCEDNTEHKYGVGKTIGTIVLFPIGLLLLLTKRTCKKCGSKNTKGIKLQNSK